MKVVVTGGSGFIGTNLVEHFAATGHQVLNIDIRYPRDASHAKFFRNCDICDKDTLTKVLQEFLPDVVLHLAARTDLAGHAIDDYAANTTGVANILNALQVLPVRPLAIFFSSMLVCRLGHLPTDEDDYCPSTVYGHSKVIGERLVRKVGCDKLSWIILRPTSIWGPWFGPPYRDFFEAVRRGVYPHPKGYRVRRNYGFVLNSVFQIERLVNICGGDLLGRTIYLADQEPVELLGWAKLISKALNAPPVREIPEQVLRVAARIGDVAKALGYQRAPISSFRLNNMLTECVLDVGPLNKVSGPVPYTIEQAVGITCQWMISHFPKTVSGGET